MVPVAAAMRAWVRLFGACAVAAFRLDTRQCRGRIALRR